MKMAHSKEYEQVEDSYSESSDEETFEETSTQAPTTTKKCNRCGIQVTAAPEKLCNHVKFCRNKAKKTALKNSEKGRRKSKGGNKNKGNRQRWNVLIRGHVE